jgi:DNA-binding CsgD family transcriptional regulator
VADRNGAARRPLAGRAGEIDALNSLLHAAARGDPGALLISGEAGVGKTALVREVTAGAHGRADLLWAPCLPLTSLAVPFLPLTSALRQWAADRDDAVPLLQPSGEPGTGDGPVEFDGWLDERCRERPVALVIDDLHWADQSTLDVLTYVLAMLAGKRLVVITTLRTGEQRAPLRRWLADVRRLPGIRELRLDRLDRAATAEQLTGLLGGPPHETLVDQVYARTDGNAYLTTLLVRGLPSNARALPADLPSELRDAATRAWRSLSEPAQALTQLVAVTGRRQRADELGKLAAQTGMSGDLVSLLREAVDAAVLDVGADDTYWFVHPLLAEVLESGLLPEERRALHEACANTLAGYASSDEVGELERAIDLADHHYRAGHRDEAYRWALLGADAAGRASGPAEMLRLLRRALDLWPAVAEPKLSHQDLLGRIRQAADQAGDQEEELAAVEDLLAAVDPEQQPLMATELLVRRMLLRLSTGRQFAGLDDVREAVRLSAAVPESGEHALAVAELAHAELWHGVPSGPARAEEAVRLARVCGSKRALAYALTAHVMARVIAWDSESALTAARADAAEAQAAAAEVRDFWAYTHATNWAANCIDQWSPEVLEIFRHGRDAMTALGAQSTYVTSLSSNLADGLLLRGKWQSCLDALRLTLGSTPGAMAATSARLTAAMLAAWQGRPTEARAHLARADELFAEHSGFLAFGFDAVRASVAIAAGDSEAAITAALAGVDGTATYCERLLPIAARAAADQAQTLRDRGTDPAPAVQRLVDLQRTYPQVIVDPGPGPMYLLQLRAMQALYNAEVLRGLADSGAPTAWRDAAQACADAELPWDEAYARRRAAEALLSSGSARQEAAVELRRAYELATALAAAPLLADIEALARTARVRLTTPGESPPDAMARMPGLTAREREILAHLVAGRTYGEIARDLVISEKTVSVHVSNMLHKTGTSNRVELAGLARRLDSAAAQDGKIS